jgi:hypothetical protein
VRVLRAVGAALVGLVVGLAVGVAGVLWHHAHVVVGDDRWPLGALLVVPLAGLAVLALGAGTAGRPAPVAFVLAVAATAALATTEGPGGDTLVVQDLLGQAYLLGTGVAAVLALVVVRRLRRGPATAGAA